jgi:thiol-disulfide isomerase/thioredoxin
MRLSTVVLLSIANIFATGLKVQPGQTAPRFSLVRLDSAQRRVNLRDFADSSRHALHPEFGHPVVLSFWSTTCVNCKAEFPRLQRWAAAHPSVEFLPILVEDADPAQGTQWLRSAGVKENGLLDRYQVAGKAYGVCEGEICTVPALVAIGPDQQVKLARQGYHPERPLEADLDKALSLTASP